MKTKIAIIALTFTLLMLFYTIIPVGATEPSEELPTIEWITPPFEAIVTYKGESTHFKSNLENGVTKIIEVNGIPQNSSYIQMGSVYPWGNIVVSGSAKYAWASQFLKNTPYGDLIPTVHIHLDAIAASQLFISVIWIKYLGEALTLPSYVPQPCRGIVREYLCTIGIGTNVYHTAKADSNTDGSLDIWIPIDDYNYKMWRTTHSIYLSTPNYWWLV